MRRPITFSWALPASLLAICAHAAAPLVLPATFTGDLPCADCEAIRHVLELRSDGAFFLRVQYIGKGDDATRDSIGRWEISSDGLVLALRGGLEAPDLYSVRDPDTLRKRDLDGNEIASSLNYDLKRDDAAPTLEPSVRMAGLYTSMADSGWFTECATGLRVPVAMTGDNTALERAYAETRSEPNAPVLMQLEGQLAQRPKMEGEGTVLSLVPERFIKAWPAYRCASPVTVATMIDTEWILVRLGTEPVIPPERRRAPTLQFMADRKLAGYDGCNRMAGQYTLDADRLSFGPMASTRMACPPWPGIHMEAAFVQVLEATAKWRTLGRQLDLLHADGSLLARFDARAKTAAKKVPR